MQGSVQPGAICALQPVKQRLRIMKIQDCRGKELSSASAGDSVQLVIAPNSADGTRQATDSDGALQLIRIRSSSIWGLHAAEALSWLIELRVFGLEPHGIRKGFRGLLHFGAEAVVVTITEFMEAFDMHTQNRVTAPEAALANTLTQCMILLPQPTALDVFTGGQLGRFVLRCAGLTVGTGKILAPMAGQRTDGQTPEPQQQP